MSFNLENYEPVKARKKRFFKDYPDGRILPETTILEKDWCLITTKVYKNKEELASNLPLSRGHAQEFKGQGGMANKSAWTENCEESSIGRALDNAGYATDMKCSREEMIKVMGAEERVEHLRSELLELMETYKDSCAVDELQEFRQVYKDGNEGDLKDAINRVSEVIDG